MLYKFFLKVSDQCTLLGGGGEVVGVRPLQQELVDICLEPLGPVPDLAREGRDSVGLENLTGRGLGAHASLIASTVPPVRSAKEHAAVT